MATVGVVIETEDGRIKATNYGVLTAARGEGNNEIWALLMDSGEAEAKEVLARYGARKIVAVSAGDGDLTTSPDLQAKAIAAATKELSLKTVLGLASAKGKDLFARLAAELDQPLVSDCMAVDIDTKTVRKSHFSGKTVATIKLNGDIMLCTLRPNVVEAREAPGDAEVVDFDAHVESSGRVTVVDLKKSGSGKMDLTEASIIITGGRPIAAAENYQILDACAEQLGAAVGASRAAVDAGYAPHSMQVGQTGKTVSPKLYIGCGLSGSVQHFAGMKTSKVIVAINTDKDAPIFEKCDYGIVGDLFEVVPALTEALKARS